MTFQDCRPNGELADPQRGAAAVRTQFQATCSRWSEGESLEQLSLLYLCFKRLVPVEGRCWREVLVLVSPRSRTSQKNSCQAPSRLTSSCQNVPISCHCKEKAILILPRELMAGPKSKIYLSGELLAGQTSKFFLAKVWPGPVWPRQFSPNGVSG